LDTPSGRRDKSFNGGGVEATSELFFLGFDTRNDGNRQQLFVYPSVKLEDLSDLNVSLCFGEVGSVTFLPKELAGTKERFCVAKKSDPIDYYIGSNCDTRGFLNSHRTTLFH
jgi:hypothetical protein